MNTATPGYKTTEFWLTIAANVVGSLLTSGLITDDRVLQVLGLTSMILSSLGYTVARAMVKRQAGALIPPPYMPSYRPDPNPYEKEDDTQQPVLIHDKIGDVVPPNEERKIPILQTRTAPCKSLVIQFKEHDSKNFTIENLLIGGQPQWKIPAPAFMLTSHPVVIFDERIINPDEEIAIIVKNRSDEASLLAGEAAVMEARA